MERMRRVMQVWNWLPAFRAVAETQSLTRAAKQIHLTKPALSRTLRLLEDDLGTPLFERDHGHLVLNAAGRRLLASTRTAIRLVHDALQELEAAPHLDLHVASVGPFTILALEDTLARLVQGHPTLRPRVCT